MADPSSRVDPETGEVRRSFSDFLRDHKRGALDDQLTVDFAELLELVRMLGAAGQLTLTVKVVPQDDGLVISTRSSMVPPKAPALGAFYFHGDDGMPSTRDPRQPVLDQWSSAAANTDAADLADDERTAPR